jgi:hypothetical protein
MDAPITLFEDAGFLAHEKKQFPFAARFCLKTSFDHKIHLAMYIF